jgi:drug/metabolite transporter (DMT)-like permease
MIRQLRERRADVIMAVVTVIWAVHYIVVKDALDDLAPFTFNSLRYLFGLPIILIAGLRSPASLRIARRDVPQLVGLGLIGAFGYTIFFILGMQRTTSTNTALLIATMPTWTALLMIGMGMVMIRRMMIAGILISLIGVTFVILGRSGAALSVSQDDLSGSVLILCAAIVAALYGVNIKPLIDRYGGPVMAFWSYCLTTAGLAIVAAPNLIHLSADDLPMSVLPNLFYSGWLACAFGFLGEYYAIRTIGPARTASYYNFIPVIGACAGILILGEPLTAGLVVGGILTLSGVLIVRRHSYMRPKPVIQPLPEAYSESVLVGADAAR